MPGNCGRLELVRLLIPSTCKVDASSSPEFSDQIQTYGREYEKMYVTKIVELMEIYEKPLIGVSLDKTGLGSVRLLAGKRYNGVFCQTPKNAITVLAKMFACQRFIAQL